MSQLSGYLKMTLKNFNLWKQSVWQCNRFEYQNFLFVIRTSAGLVYSNSSMLWNDKSAKVISQDTPLKSLFGQARPWNARYHTEYLINLLTCLLLIYIYRETVSLGCWGLESLARPKWGKIVVRIVFLKSLLYQSGSSHSENKVRKLGTNVVFKRELDLK